ncbi:hypothetical protein, partial [Thermoplasma sp.]|uniref:hypothetical protein n=1 Tax=Thermoplasma sp. TaxID=1973142 RepID=UPI00261D4F55
MPPPPTPPTKTTQVTQTTQQQQKKSQQKQQQSSDSTNTYEQTAKWLANQFMSNYNSDQSEGVISASTVNSGYNFYEYMQSLKQTNPQLYNQLINNPTIKQALQTYEKYVAPTTSYVMS